MLDRFESAIERSFSLIPDWIVSILVVAAAVALALVIAQAADRLLRRAFAVGHPYLYSLLMRLEGPLRLALILLALNFAVAAAPLDSDLATVLGYALRVAFIAMVGWMAMTAVNIAADVYLRRLDVTASNNLHARKQVTQVRILKGAVNTLLTLITIAAALMSFESVRRLGVSLFASAGIAGIVVGFAARPMLSNLIAGIQLALTQPIRIGDAIVVENEWGWIEDITATYVVVRVWDWRRLVLPLTHFIEKPFQNWTRENASLIGTVLFRLDFAAPIEKIRSKAEEIVRASKLWDGRVVAVQVTDSDDRTLELRVLASAQTAGTTFDLRCEVREKLLREISANIPEALPRTRENHWQEPADFPRHDRPMLQPESVRKGERLRN